ncbi:MAG: SAM-dependent chlorinase/fluorinase [Deltaproteobacteria bacterium]|nr:SAM-dependent chlorinase/fluorinase [Deltaproteobacteria bacterium]
MKASGVITLTTDFGLSDPYVGVMKGVVLTINPLAMIIDLSHQVKPGSVMEGAGVLSEAHPYFPQGAVHVAVVDPGVGGKRRPILVVTKNHVFVGPDNGIFWPIMETLQDKEIYHLTNKEYFLHPISRTFHGRDIFAPAAAHLSKGADPARMGHVINDPVKLDIPAPVQKGEVLSGQVMGVDHFGNLVTNIRRRDLGFVKTGQPVIRVGDLTVEGLHKTYSGVAKGEALAMIGSSGFLEISVNLGRACDRVGADGEETIGRQVRVTTA